MSTPDSDQRFTQIRHLDMTYSFTAPKSPREWNIRAKYLREQILTGTGLLPMPEKTPLNARIFDRVKRDGYTIEKVYFESFPGFYVTGNLYHPLGKKGPFPAVLNMHGHATEGRLEDTERCSVIARCANFAKQGYVAFAYDMIGYNDSFQLRHREDLLGQREHLWGISMGGLQLWNSIRALDFITSLPDVDGKRVACTGNSGGGTQTFMLTAVDARVKAAAPVCMISSYMQGGCVCENPPLVRIDTNNMEIGALAAPRPLILVSATGDWTNKTPEVEFPAIQNLYRLLDAEDKVTCNLIDAGHHYNKTGRESVYAWFGKWMLNDKDTAHFGEQSYHAELSDDLLLWAHESKPTNALDANGIIESRIKAAEKQLADMKPHDQTSLDAFRKTFGPALMHCLAVEMPKKKEIVVLHSDTLNPSHPASKRLLIGRKDTGDAVPITVITPSGRINGTVVLVGESCSLAEALLQTGLRVVTVECFNTGAHIGPPENADRLTRYKFYDTYNRTDTANRVQDILTALAWADDKNVALVGIGEAGLWCMLARAFAPNVRHTVVDANGFNNTSDQEFVEKLYAPSLRRAGDFSTAAALIALGKLFIHNTGGRFKTDWIENVYQAACQPERLSIRGTKASDQAIMDWLTR